MKKQLHVLLLLASTIVFGQSTPDELDYFIQFNGNQFSKKVALDEILNHDALKKISNSNSDFNIKEYLSFVNLDKNSFIHGNYTSHSRPFYQITIPITNSQGLKDFIIKQTSSKVQDSIGSALVEHENYTVYTNPKESVSMAWNKEYLIFIEFLKPRLTHDNYSNLYDIPYPDYEEPVIVEETEEIVDEAVEEVDTEVVVEEETPEEWKEEGEDPVVFIENYDYEKENEAYLKQLEEERLERIALQQQQIAFLFENGFKVPTSDKITTKADISAWVNYQSVFNSIKDFSGIIQSIAKGSRDFSTDDIDSFIKGVNFNMYFDNDQARMEQIVEYSSPLASLMKKVVNRKVNKNIFKYFPNESPLAFMSYHINSEEALNGFPAITAQMYPENKFLQKEDVELLTDFIETLLDEKAIASLMDGDFTFFLHDISQTEYTYTSYEYDENYEEIAIEKTDTKNTPIFTVVLTSTHKTMGQKLLNLAERKGGLIKENNYYKVRGVENELGDLRILKEGDVMVITNGYNHINRPNTSFSTQFKQQMKHNFAFGNLNMKDLMAQLAAKEHSNKDKDKMHKVSQQFEVIDFKSSKKMENNKLQIEMSLRSSVADKNIILQTLDLISILNN
ncbi:MAG: hypothetical protein CMP76_05695 [Flavobacterium sp.]|uniref:hypothetical protein n=1 Tax=Flavobacterium sp. TaxID=239 RepID=UPI000C58C158|nr:hypothetical protein [Flavobacterium sp.]MBF02771.1 hypothetical protein [Flavobacterium sp.]|tara:strand:- start:639 stop:2498 length:1860 start_codon:yes stop_codon:yes gene_type:complete